MSKIKLKKTRTGKPSISIKQHKDYLLRIVTPIAQPYRLGSQRAMAWQVISLMDGLTILDAHNILEKLEPNIQGKVGRPLGWIVDAVERGFVEVHKPL